MKTKILFGSFILLATCFSCSTPKHLPQPRAFKDHVKGLHFEGELHNKIKVEGEIIEVTDQELFLLPNLKKRKMVVIIRSDLKEGDIIVSGISDKSKHISTWASLMTLTTIGHGAFGLFSIPINLISAISVSNNAAKGTYRVKFPAAVHWEGMRKFARFPQGLPDGINLEDIR